MSEVRNDAQTTEQQGGLGPIVQSLDRHDCARLAQLASLLGDAERLSLEGEPIYADRGWDQFHAFSHATVIPTITGMVPQAEPQLDVLYDDCTALSTAFSLDYYLEQIVRTESDSLPKRVTQESDLLDRARDWVAQLQAAGQTTLSSGITRLNSERPVTLTTQSGRPTCAVLDAAYQMQKAENGVDTVVLVHNTNFRGQQIDMQTVLRAVNGSIPFENFANVYMRQRKGALRLAAIQVLSATAQLVEIK